MANRRVRVIRSGCPKVKSRGGRLESTYALVGLAPGLVWLTYFYIKGRSRSRLFSNILRVFLWSAACTLPAGVIEHFFGATLIQETLVRSALASFLLIGPIEELSKLLSVWIAVYRRPDFREPIDGLVYATTAALGFASVENIIYIGQMGADVLVSRTLYATPAHVLFSSMWGYSLGLARFKRDGEIWIVFQGFFMAALFHGAYNFLVAIDPKTAIISLIPLMIIMGWVMSRRIREFRSKFPFSDLGNCPLVICPGCGAYASEEEGACARCGMDLTRLDPDAARFCGRCRARINMRRDTCPLCGARVKGSRGESSTEVCSLGPRSPQSAEEAASPGDPSHPKEAANGY